MILNTACNRALLSVTTRKCPLPSLITARNSWELPHASGKSPLESPVESICFRTIFVGASKMWGNYTFSFVQWTIMYKIFKIINKLNLTAECIKLARHRWPITAKVY